MDNRHKNRETLKSYFQKGRVPTEEQFAALIDSLHNINDDGCLTATEDDGLILYPAGNGRVLASLFSRQPVLPDAKPLWRISLADDGSLVISNGQGVKFLVIGKDGSVAMPERKDNGSGEDREEPKEESVPDSDGIVKVKADGYWHDLPVEAAVKGRVTDAGCTAFPPAGIIRVPGNMPFAKLPLPIRTVCAARCRPAGDTGGDGPVKSKYAGRYRTASCICR